MTRDVKFDEYKMYFEDDKEKSKLQDKRVDEYFLDEADLLPEPVPRGVIETSGREMK